MDKDLKGYWAVVTGASSGIGEVFARQLAARRVNLVLTARREDRLEKLAAELRSDHGIETVQVPLDLGLPDAPEALHRAATAGGRPIGILINNAGFGPYSNFLKSPLERHVATLRVNTLALTELCHRFAPSMTAQKRRSYIVNVASVAAFQGTPKFAVYSGTKSYVRVFSEILRFELKGTNVTVSCLCPGGTLTEFLEANNQTLKNGGNPAMMTAEQVVRAGIEGMLDGKAVVVPGLLNKVACFFPRLVPRGLALSIAASAMSHAIAEKETLS